MVRNDIRSLFGSYWTKQGFSGIKPLPIVPPASWTHSLFVVSGLVGYADLAMSRGRFENDLFVCQPCVKLGTAELDLEDMLGNGQYLTFFEQLSCGGSSKQALVDMIAKVWRFMSGELGIGTGRLHVGLPIGFESLAECCVTAGVLSENIICPDLSAFRLDVAGRIRGSYIPFYAQLEKSGQGEASSVLMEICDIGLIEADGVRILDHGMGMERLILLLDGKNDIAKLADFQNAANLLDIGAIENGPRRSIIDHLRTSLALSASGIMPGNKGRAYCLRSLIRRAYWHLSMTKGVVSQVEARLPELWDIFGFSWFFPKAEPRLCVRQITTEMAAAGKLLDRAYREIYRLLKNKTALSRDDLAYLHSTHGIPPSESLRLARVHQA